MLPVSTFGKCISYGEEPRQTLRRFSLALETSSSAFLFSVLVSIKSYLDADKALDDNARSLSGKDAIDGEVLIE